MALPLVRALAACFEADPLIDEYDFVPLLTDPTAAEGGGPESCFLVEGHKLAISAAAVKPLFREAHAAFQQQQQQHAAGLIDVTRALLLVNPDVYTAWNARKRLIAAGTISSEAELAFVDLVFSKHTKKACAWAHRRWCLARLDDGDDNTELDARESHELSLAASICERFPKNYYAWTHRWWVVEAGAKRRRRRQTRGPTGVGAWLGAQVAFGEAWVERHVWDMSAASFLHHVLRAWAREQGGSEEPMGRARGMLAAGARKIDQCPGHESLWYLRRGLLALYVERQAERRQGQSRVALAPPSPSTDAPAPYPPPLVEGGEGVDVGELLAWEVRMAEYYRRGQGPFHAEEGAGLLWEAAARRRQRVCAWAYARWVLELAVRHGVVVESSGDGGMEGWTRYLGEGLEGSGTSGRFVPPGYGKLVGQLG